MKQLAVTGEKSTVRILVIGVGAEFRGDDGIGLMAIARLREKSGFEDVDLAVHSDDPARLMSSWDGRDRVVVIDAVRTGAAVGTLHRIELPEGKLALPGRVSSHGATLADAIDLSRALGTLPRQFVILGIEAGMTAIGDNVSAECQASIAPLVQEIRREIACMSLQ